VIEISELSKYYGARKAIGPLSFSIEAGEIVGLLGLNGAGKTTTLRILACDLLPSSGTVRVEGLDVVESPHDVRRLIGYVPDTPPLYDEMTVRAYLHFAARLRGLSRADAEARVREVEDATELVDVSSEIIASLSHGFRQRVGIAQAIVHKPRLLVLDEPISGLDPVQIVEMRELLKSLRGEHTILISSHILSEISETCDRLLVIRDGQIAASGTEAELTSKLLRGARVEVTLRGDAALAHETASRVPGVSRVSELPPAEPGERVATLLVEADRDVREPLLKALVDAGVGLLGVARSERELESVFLELAGPQGGEETAAAKRSGARKKKRAQKAAESTASAPAPTPAAEPSPSHEEDEK
jgi:ABC-2 type transport system ATP-binding protein